MYQIKRGDEVLNNGEPYPINNLAHSMGGILEYEYKSSDEIHLLTLELMDLFIEVMERRKDNRYERKIAKNISLIAAKYGLTIEEVKDV